MIPHSQNRLDRWRGRTTQRGVIPTGVKSRNLSDFIFGADDATASASMGNGDGYNIQVTLTQNDDYAIQANPYIALYVDSITAATQLFPTLGASETLTDWQIAGPSYDYHLWNDNNYPAANEYVSMRVENISAGSVTLYVYANWRYISPQEQ